MDPVIVVFMIVIICIVFAAVIDCNKPKTLSDHMTDALEPFDQLGAHSQKLAKKELAFRIAQHEAVAKGKVTRELARTTDRVLRSAEGYRKSAEDAIKPSLQVGEAFFEMAARERDPHIQDGLATLGEAFCFFADCASEARTSRLQQCREGVQNMADSLAHSPVRNTLMALMGVHRSKSQPPSVSHSSRRRNLRLPSPPEDQD